MLSSGFAGKRISEEEGSSRLAPSSTMLRLHSTESCVLVVVRVFQSDDINQRAAGRFEQLYLNAQAQSVCSWVVMPNCSICHHQVAV